MDKPIITHKTCTGCKLEQPVGMFNLATRNLDGLEHRCKTCRAAERVEAKNRPRPTTKACTQCKADKPIQFFSQGSGQYGLQSICKECSAEYEKTRQLKPKPAIENKTCAHCNEMKPAEDFQKMSRAADGLHRRCRQCVKDTRAPLTPEQKAAFSLRIKTSRPQRRDKLRENGRNYYRNSIRVNPDQKAVARIRDTIAKAIGRGAGVKTQKTEVYLGCTIAEARAHIESQFREGMSWNNWTRYGWHLDHIRPLASFDKSDPDWAIKANHYTNLQPLWATENLAKADKWDPRPRE